MGTITDKMTKEAVIKNIQSGHGIYQYEQFLNDFDVANIAIELDCYNYTYLSKEIQDDKTLALKVIKQSPSLLAFVSPRLKCDIDIVLTAISIDGEYICYANESLRNQYEIALKAIQQSAFALFHLNDEFQNKREFLEILKLYKFDPENITEDVRIWYKERMKILEKYEEADKLNNVIKVCSKPSLTKF
jgi:hypothetical protein